MTARRGRPPKYTPETVAKIIQAVEQGAPYRHACAYGGISEDTFAVWRNRYPDFSDAIKAAESRAVVGRLVRIRVAESEHWQAAAWWLERKFPNEFGRTVQEHTGPNGSALTIRVEYVDSHPETT